MDTDKHERQEHIGRLKKRLSYAGLNPNKAMAAATQEISERLKKLLETSTLMKNEKQNVPTTPVLVDAEGLRKMFNPPPSVRTIRQWQKARIIPFIKVGGRVWFNPEEVMKTLTEKRTIRPR